MPKKRPFASEGHLGLPRDLAPKPAGTRSTGPFDRGGRTRLVLVEDDRLDALDLRAGDGLVIVAGRAPEFGDLALVEEEGTARVWKVFPEDGALHLSDGRTRRRVTAAAARIAGVVVAVRRSAQGLYEKPVFSYTP